MKIISHLLLLVIATMTLTACDSGTGPSKPAAEKTSSSLAK
ncbi:hypothetical protein [Methylobacter sp. S3L5C]|nr:hypothetical protein [Methylobacter sp. S3L5C]